MIGIVELLIVLAIIGLVAWLLIKYVPMPEPVRGVIIVVAVLFCLLLVLQAFGGLGLSVPAVRVG